MHPKSTLKRIITAVNHYEVKIYLKLQPIRFLVLSTSGGSECQGEQCVADPLRLRRIRMTKLKSFSNLQISKFSNSISTLAHQHISTLASSVLNL